MLYEGFNVEALSLSLLVSKVIQGKQLPKDADKYFHSTFFRGGVSIWHLHKHMNTKNKNAQGNLREKVN